MGRISAPGPALAHASFGGVVHVAACIIRDPSGHVLMARRRPEQISGGFWEMPGGKVEPGETAIAAAARELHEETGLNASVLKHFSSYTHRYSTGRVRLDFFAATHWGGSPKGQENQQIAWVDPARPQISPVLPSNRKILNVLSLPKRVICAAAPASNATAWVNQTLDAALETGAQAILVAGRDLPPAQRSNLARRLANKVAARGVRVWQSGISTHAAGRSDEPMSILRDAQTLPQDPGSDMIFGLMLGQPDRLIAAPPPPPPPPADVHFVSLREPDDTSSASWAGFRALTGAVAAPAYAVIPNHPAMRAAALAAGAWGVCIDDDAVMPTGRRARQVNG